MADILQCNQEELAGLTVEAMKEEQTVGHLFTLGVKGVMVTRGVDGVSLYRSENKTVLHRSYPAVNGIRPRVSVGAGDVFGAAAFYRYLKTRNLEEAVTDGIAAASAWLRGRGEV
jgi:sugar/nucleoside kinase (ribokinase family)